MSSSNFLNKQGLIKQQSRIKMTRKVSVATFGRGSQLSVDEPVLVDVSSVQDLRHEDNPHIKSDTNKSKKRSPKAAQSHDNRRENQIHIKQYAIK